MASAKAEERIDTTLTLEKLRRKNYIGTGNEGDYYLDTAITNHLPHFNALELFTYYRFLFDLGKDDSMVCERCSEEYYSILKDGGYYRYFYKGIPVIGAYIDVSVDNNSKLTRIVVHFESFKNFDTTFRLTPEQAAVFAVNEHARVHGWPIPQEDSYYRKNAMKYYRYSGIMAENKQLVHLFDFINWGVSVSDRSGYAFAREKGNRF
ncbi:MAG TPA: hypothetical protein PK230_15980 [Chitinophagales bacterium]|nr:hypothetical protein [Chitinophagales bacterium]